MTDQRTLRSLHTELRQVAHELADSFERKVIRDDRTTTTHQLPPLLEQLRAAVPTGGERGRGGRRGTPIPIDPDATDMLDRIVTDARRLRIEAYATDNNLHPTQARRFVPISTVEADIRAIATITGRWADQDRVTTALDYLRGWHTEILSLLDPPRRLTIAAPCPDCEKRMVWRLDDTGQLVQTDALVYDSTTGCTCLNCGRAWPPGQLEHLARVIDAIAAPQESTA